MNQTKPVSLGMRDEKSYEGSPGGSARFLCRFLSSACFFRLPPAPKTTPENRKELIPAITIFTSIEFGYRASEINGNINTYDTFENLGSGVRLFDYTLEMRSLDHKGFLFDNLSFSNFGYGGDPNDVTRLRIEKNKWYDFRLLFRRDKNFWDYNLFANPLNPAALNPPGSLTTGCYVGPPTPAFPQGAPAFCSSPAVAQNNSLHALDLVRRMQDYDLTLLPISAVRFRLGYSRNRDEGPGFFTTDGGTISDFNRNVQLHNERLSRWSRLQNPSANDNLLRRVPQLFQAG